MDFLRVILVTVGAALLALAWVARRMQRERRGDQGLQQTDWTGSVIDVSAVTPRIERLRRDYVGEVRAREVDWAFHETLLAAAREVISRLPFFTAACNRRDHRP